MSKPSTITRTVLCKSSISRFYSVRIGDPFLSAPGLLVEFARYECQGLRRIDIVPMPITRSQPREIVSYPKQFFHRPADLSLHCCVVNRIAGQFCEEARNVGGFTRNCSAISSRRGKDSFSLVCSRKHSKIFESTLHRACDWFHFYLLLCCILLDIS